MSLQMKNSLTITSSNGSGIVTTVYLVFVGPLAARVSSTEARFCTLDPKIPPLLVFSWVPECGFDLVLFRDMAWGGVQ